MFPKVSIVVPIYKVEKYIHRCIESILEQTYTNLEIILVNDGSPDNCGKIIDEYAGKDNRIHVVHKKNGGLSDARNKGMEYATGEYTLFVDSDDWLERNMVEVLVKISLDYQADVVQSAFYYAYNDHLLYDNRYFSQNDPHVLLNKKELMYELVRNEKVKNFAWGKLYKTNLIKNLPFKKGVLFEDVFWAHLVMHRVNTYVISHKPMYYYLQRDESIVANYSLRNLDIIEGLKERHKFIEQHYDNLIDESFTVILTNCLIHYNLLMMNRRIDENGICKKRIRSYIKMHYKEFLAAVKGNKEMKTQLLLFHIHPIINFSFLALRKISRKLKVLPQQVGFERKNFSFKV
ncbi:glycosyltransferase family 2 protein [Bacillus sp. FJAT-49732]|uniref:Glycosyltransferase family 2 protein n=1 Tax=Lederbergia citrisecunda TaxID=2833583 RepID=A0A942YIK1_9BACI|nr:glycosyltransferase family 2 protein [Lederbergia citrisecunda]MBS4198408.1 glycosyltransferase family 2 protein [Lederbergia citrisecunda]